jgi:alkaline phosphatase
MHRPQIRRRTAGGALAGLAAVGCLTAVLVGSSGTGATGPTIPANRSVIILNGDGMGPAQRTFIQYALYGTSQTQPMDSLAFSGSLRTQSASTQVITDSSAGATAWASGQHTFNNRAGVGTQKKNPIVLPTLLTQARNAGKTTALVEDHDVTNATMAGFAAHTISRDRKITIARQELRWTKPDIMFGGGEEIWYPAGNPGKIPDVIDDDKSVGKENLVDEAQKAGYGYAWDKASLDKLTGPKALALVQDDALERSEAIKGYDPATDPNYVPEHELVQKALDIGAKNPKGLFMAIDVDEIDDAGHDHDGPLMLRAGAELNAIVTVLKNYQAAHPETLIVVTADHETGGMTIEPTNDGGSGVDPDDPIPYYGGKPTNVAKAPKVPADSGPFAIKDDGRKIALDWTTAEHSGVNVPVTASGPNADMFSGVHENTFVYHVARETMFGAP